MRIHTNVGIQARKAGDRDTASPTARATWRAAGSTAVRWILLSAALAPPAMAQLQFGDLGKRHLPNTREQLSTVVAIGDIDGDGDRDTFFGGFPDSLYVNDGTGVFTDGSTTRLPAQPPVITWAALLRDVDGDGDLDLVLGNDGQDRLYLNDGTGHFTDATSTCLPVDTTNTGSLAAGDVDRDGDLDLVLGTPGGQSRLYRNNGAGIFVDATATGMPQRSDPTTAVTLCDVDGDGDPDLVVGNHDVQDRLYLNDGAGHFTDATTTRMPVDTARTSAVLAGDVDGDGDLDLVLTTRRVSLVSRLYTNNGQGTFTDVTSSQFLQPNTATSHCASLVDVEGDGDLDIVLGNDFQDQLYLNDGSGRFTDGTAAHLPFNRDLTASMAGADVDGDGDVDLVTADNSGPNLLLMNDGAGFFVLGTTWHIPSVARPILAIATGDVDGDRDPDLVISLSGVLALYANDGRAVFTLADVGHLPPTFSEGPLLICDVDQDGDLDLIAGDGDLFDGSAFDLENRHNRLLLNDGTGTFADVTATHLPGLTETTMAMAVGDVDGDGDTDLVVANGWTVAVVGGARTGQNRLYLNDGTGRFTDATAGRMPVYDDLSWAVAMLDADGDGDLDLVFGNSLLQNRQYLNDGTGHFTDVTVSHMPTDQDDTRGVAVGDVDGDGDTDLVFANGGGGRTGEQNRLYLNDGLGHFTDVTSTRLPAVQDRTNSMALADVDGDGDLDLVLANGGFACFAFQNEFWVNDGLGRFVDMTAAIPQNVQQTQTLVAFDADGDGDTDVMFGNGGCQNYESQLLLNLLRQIDSPLLVRVGRPFRLDVYSRFGPPRLVDVALPYLSTGSVAIPVPPYGTLGLDLSQAFPLQPFVMPTAEGAGSTTVQVPNDRNLIGLQVYAQALLIQYPRLQLTNTTVDVVFH